jgi:hypothetical protein
MKLSHLSALLTSIAKADEISITYQMFEDKHYPTPTVEVDGYSFAFSFSSDDGDTFSMNIYNSPTEKGLFPDWQMLAFDKKYTRSSEEYKEVLMTMCGISSYPSEIYGKVIDEISLLLFSVQERVKHVSRANKR